MAETVKPRSYEQTDDEPTQREIIQRADELTEQAQQRIFPAFTFDRAEQASIPEDAFWELQTYLGLGEDLCANEGSTSGITNIPGGCFCIAILGLSVTDPGLKIEDDHSIAGSRPITTEHFRPWRPRDSRVPPPNCTPRSQSMEQGSRPLLEEPPSTARSVRMSLLGDRTALSVRYRAERPSTVTERCFLCRIQPDICRYECPHRTVR